MPAAPYSFVTRVQGRSLFATQHAVERYMERVRPGLDIRAACDEMRLVLRHGDFQAEPPYWISSARTDGDESQGEEWLVLGDGIAFPIAEERLLTCLSKGTRSEKNRKAHAQHRANHVPGHKRVTARKLKGADRHRHRERTYESERYDHE